MLKAIFITSLTSVLLASTPAASARIVKPPAAIPVASTIHSQDANGAAYGLGGDNAIAGTGDAYRSYTVSTKSDWLTSQILSTQDWQLAGLNSATRKFSVRFGSPVGGSPVNPLPDSYVRGTFQTLCSNWGDAEALGGMKAGQVKTCGMIFNFSVDDTSTLEYRIAFHEKNLQTDASDQVSIYCVSAGSDGKCSNWTIDPVVPLGSVGTLVKITYARNGQIVLTPVGYYNYTFHFDITK